MNTTPIPLPDRVMRFVKLRQEQGGVSAVLIYGSYARGTQHELSDVDIIFVVDDGFASKFVVFEGLDFEVLESTKRNMIAYWQKNWDEDRHWYLWKDAKIIYDRDGEGASVVKHALSLIKDRQPWSGEQMEMRRNVMLAKLRKIQYLSNKDPIVAAILLTEIVRSITEHWFLTRGQFVPSPKEFMGALQQEEPEFSDLLKDFYMGCQTDRNERIDLVGNMLKIVYQ